MSPADAAPAVHEWPGGLTWLAHPEEPMQRASHALAPAGSVWLVDPLEAPGVHDELQALGEVAGVVVLLDRHTRDAAAFAAHYDVPVYVPEAVADGVDDLGASLERFSGELADTGYRARPVIENRFWREAALVGDFGATAVVPEALGTARFYTAPGERLGVSPPLRLFPPRRQLSDLDPERLLVGHGEPVLEDAGGAIRVTLAGARRRAPRALWSALREALRG